MNERLKELRLATGMTLSLFGKKIGISTGGLSDLERGRNPVQERHIKLILAAFPRVDEAWLRTGEGDMFRPEQDGRLDDLIKRLDLPDIANTFVAIYDQLPPDAQTIVLEYAHKVITDLMDKAGANAKLTDRDVESLQKDMNDEVVLEKKQAEKSEASTPGNISMA